MYISKHSLLTYSYQVGSTKEIDMNQEELPNIRIRARDTPPDIRPRRTRRQYHDLSRKGQGRVKYQVNEKLAGFRKGDIVRVKGKYVKQINSIYSNGRLAFKRVKGEPPAALPKDCQLLERGQTILWEKAG